MIEGLQKRTSDVVSSMQTSITTSNESVNQAQETHTAIREICKSLSEIMDLTQLIATAAKEQSLASSDISGQLSTLSGSSFELLELANENREGGQRMSAQGIELNSATSVFKS